jgi:hypothetical protein
MGNLNENTRTVTGIGFAPDPAPVVQAHENLQSLLYDPGRFPSLTVRYKADTAGIMFPNRIIQPLLVRQLVICHGFPPPPDFLGSAFLWLLSSYSAFLHSAFFYNPSCRRLCNKKGRTKEEVILFLEYALVFFLSQGTAKTAGKFGLFRMPHCIRLQETPFQPGKTD